MKTERIAFYALALFTLLTTSCGNDDNSIIEPIAKEEPNTVTDSDDESEDLTEPLANQRQAVLDGLTNTDEKVWKITEAILTNESGTIDISSNFNITDDELVFINSVFEGSKTDFNGTLEWRGGNAINTLGTTSEETLLDYYESPLRFPFDFIGESSVDLESPGFTFKYIDENSITGTVIGEESSTIALTLAPKTSDDYAKVPDEPLSFSQAFSYPSNAVSGFAPGMVGSNSTNSIFIVTRESDMNSGTGINPERVTKLDISSNVLTDQLYFQSDFVSKQIHIVDNQLKVIGGQFINTYDIGLQSEPTTTSYDGQIALSRHGSAVIDDEIYIVGGSLGDTQNLGDEIFKWDDINNTLTQVAIMPETRSGARAETVQNKLYIFGGTEEFVGQEAKNTVFIYDLVTEQITTEVLPTGLHFTYTAKQENLIYVAGQIKTFTEDADGDGNPDGFFTQLDNEPYLGVYNTQTKEFTELNTDLLSPESETIHAMTVMNGKLYVLYGQFQEVTEGEFQNWDILVADLN